MQYKRKEGPWKRKSRVTARPLQRYAHRIVSRAAAAAGIKKPDGVGWVHLLRHSGAIERLRVTRHPPGVQAQLGHRSPFMTYRYWRTLQAEEALETSQLGVDLAR